MFLFLFNLLFLVAFTAAESAPLFCKCTCFKNSTLIQLKPGSSCTQCTHAFCLSQSLPICNDPNNNNSDPTDTTAVLSTCIQRDSRKDQIIVWAFLLGTAGLLAWAAVKRVNEMREGRKANHSAVGGGGGGGVAGVAGGGAAGRSRGIYAPVSAVRGTG
ncbi:hypothetical protein GGS20DRAFT_448745 [Poronia punctata]|nr:hypothetical protein GGS20DRAFT_448745 [Poronia punctata]